MLAKNAEVLKKFDFLKVTIEGHCDERGTVEYNLALGERRAKAAYDYLVSLGVPRRPAEDGLLRQGSPGLPASPTRTAGPATAGRKFTVTGQDDAADATLSGRAASGAGPPDALATLTRPGLSSNAASG